MKRLKLPSKRLPATKSQRHKLYETDKPSPVLCPAACVVCPEVCGIGFNALLGMASGLTARTKHDCELSKKGLFPFASPGSFRIIPPPK